MHGFVFDTLGLDIFIMEWLSFLLFGNLWLSSLSTLSFSPQQFLHLSSVVLEKSLKHLILLVSSWLCCGISAALPTKEQ